MTSSILPPRSDLAPCSPITQARASTTLDLPEPLGPTTQVMPGSKCSVVDDAKDLKPSRVRLFRCTCSHAPPPRECGVSGSAGKAVTDPTRPSGRTRSTARPDVRRRACAWATPASTLGHAGCSPDAGSCSRLASRVIRSSGWTVSGGETSCSRPQAARTSCLEVAHAAPQPRTSRDEQGVGPTEVAEKGLRHRRFLDASRMPPEERSSVSADDAVPGTPLRVRSVRRVGARPGCTGAAERQ